MTLTSDIVAAGVYSIAEIREAERRAVDAGSATMWELMEQAGLACADVLDERFPDGRVVVLAGPGNNGGDAFVAAQALLERGREVVLYEIAAADPSAGDRGKARSRWTGSTALLADYYPMREGDVVLDGLYGAGLNRDLGEAETDFGWRIREAGLPVVAIDVPSGVMGDVGTLPTFAFKADVTVTFEALKRAHVLSPISWHCGEVVVVRIGFRNHLGSTMLRRNGPELWSRRLRWPWFESHKHERGRLMVVSGGLAQTGAARLAAQAGLRVGAGAVTLLAPPSALMAAAMSVTAVMTASFADVGALIEATERASAVVIGPAAGVNEATRAHVAALAESGRKLVLDADALSVFAPDDGTLAKLLTTDAVLTPHSGEFERLFPGLLKASADKMAAAREAARRVGAVVLLKGSDTVIASPDGGEVVNTHASPFLATAGSGDVLAGIIGGLMAQGLDAFSAACAGAWLHGDAGLRSGPGTTAEDLDGTLKQAIAELYQRRGVIGL